MQALESGQLSGAVHSAFGVHLILRTETVNVPRAEVDEVVLEEEETDVADGQ
jgi:parvulin-like peptidyl-prolyl isomerase